MPTRSYVAPKATYPSLDRLNTSELRDFAAVLKQTLVSYDNLWRYAIPYVMVLHQAPTDGGDYGAFHFSHRISSATKTSKLLKYLAGPEIGGGNFLSDTAPEEKAAELRATKSVHYSTAVKESDEFASGDDKELLDDKHDVESLLAPLRRLHEASPRRGCSRVRGGGTGGVVASG